MRSRQRQPPGQQLRADHLVDGVVPAHVLAERDQQLPAGSNRAAACSPPVRSNTLCARRSASGSVTQHRAATTGPSADGCAARLDRVQRGLAADAAARRWRRSCAASRSRPAAGQPHADHVVVLLLARQRAVADPRTSWLPSIRPSVNRNPAARSKSCPGVRMVTATFRCSAPGSLDADLHRLLGGQAVAALLARAGLHGDDAGAGGAGRALDDGALTVGGQRLGRFVDRHG